MKRKCEPGHLKETRKFDPLKAIEIKMIFNALT